MSDPKKDQEETCAVCDRPAEYEYQDEPSCGRPECELAIQAALDYRDERDW